MVFVCLSPYGLGLWLNAALCAEDGYGTVKNSQRTLNLNGEVNVTRGVDNVYSVSIFLYLRRVTVELGMSPIASRGSRCDRDTSFLLLLHPVHRSRTFVRFTDLVVNARVVQDTFRGGRFTCVDMRHNTDVSVTIQRMLSGHTSLL